ncbi:MAG TPA: NUDIX hydrolase [Acidimicrobiia bacterium]|nr:NUDIX hydrolase [Acidimicrobiia bacterium]
MTEPGPDFEVRSSRSVARTGFLEVMEEDVVAPDGEVLTRYTVRHPGAVVIVAVDEHERVVMVRQFRSAARGHLLEVPAGKREPDEEPEVTARRELEEEVGLHAADLVKLSEFFNSPGFTDELTHVYLARSLSPAASGAELKAEERFMEVSRIALAEAEALMATGAIRDGKSIIGLVLARRYLEGTYAGFTPGEP